MSKKSLISAIRPDDKLIALIRVLKYSASSIVCAVLDFGLYSLLLHWLPTIGAYICARVVSAITNYQLNRRMVFRAQASARSAVGYFLLALCVMAVGSLSVNVLVYIGVHKLLAKALVDGALFIGNYLMQKWVVFRKVKQDNP